MRVPVSFSEKLMNEDLANNNVVEVAVKNIALNILDKFDLMVDRKLLILEAEPLSKKEFISQWKRAEHETEFQLQVCLSHAILV